MSYISNTVDLLKFLESMCAKTVATLKKSLVKIKTKRKIRNELQAVIAEVQVKEPRAPRLPTNPLKTKSASTPLDSAD